MTTTVTTPLGTAYFAYIFTPDTKFDDNGVYQVNLRMSKSDAKPLVKVIDNTIEETMEASKSKKKKLAPKPYFKATDSEGNETGEIEFKFKQKAVIKTKKGDMKMQPKVFDCKGKPIVEQMLVGNGSRIKIAFEPYGYDVASIGIGASLRLKAVQIVDLVNSETGGFGFGEEDGSFVVEANNNNSNTGAEDDDEEEDIFSEENEEDGDY